MDTIVRQVKVFLDETTRKAAEYFYGRTDGMLRDGQIFEFWESFQKGGLRKRDPQPYGLYFIFYEHERGLVPVYLGKGDLPGRLFVHFGNHQPIDQILSRQLTGFHGHPEWLKPDDESRQRIQNGFARLNVGLVFCPIDETMSKKEVGKRYEDVFRHNLYPVGDGDFYGRYMNTADETCDPFELHGMVECWLDKPREDVPVRDLSIDQCIEELKRRHDQFIAKVEMD